MVRCTAHIHHEHVRFVLTVVFVIMVHEHQYETDMRVDIVILHYASEICVQVYAGSQTHVRIILVAPQRYESFHGKAVTVHVLFKTVLRI